MQITITESRAADHLLPVYSLRGVGKRYGEGSGAVDALSDVDVDLVAGEMVAVVGPSGSGKSTLLQLLGGLDRPSSGTIEFEGEDLARQSEVRLAELRLERIGFIFQQFNLIPTLTARENVEAALAPRALSAERREDIVLEMLSRVDLGERAGHLPSELSGGEQQRVAIARALANEPDVLLADEPTGNLDSRSGEAILELLRELWGETGLTIVLITHDRSLAARASRMLTLADGRIQSDASTARQEMLR